MPTKKEYFKLTENHIHLLKHARVGWWECETGAPYIDPKRPYGNGDVGQDVCELMGWEIPDDEEEEGEHEELMDKAISLHYETHQAMHIILTLNGAEPGVYSRTGGYSPGPWALVKEEEKPAQSMTAV